MVPWCSTTARRTTIAAVAVTTTTGTCPWRRCRSAMVARSIVVTIESILLPGSRSPGRLSLPWFEVTIAPIRVSLVVHARACFDTLRCLAVTSRGPIQLLH